MSDRKRRPGNPRLAVAYVRASRDEQKLSPDAQRSAIEAWATREGVQVVAWHVDQGVCSVTPIDARPALCGALAALREHGAGVLVVAKRDRIARDVVLTAGVERSAAQSGAAVVSAAGEGNGDSPADGFMRTVIDGAAAYERALIRSRTRAALAAKRARGERAGTVPFGYTADEAGRLLPHAPEQTTIALVRSLRDAGLSMGAIVVECARSGCAGRSGRPLQKTQVARILRAAA